MNHIIALVFLVFGWNISFHTSDIFSGDLEPPARSDEYQRLYTESMERCNASRWMAQMLASQIEQESSWRIRAVSTANARGLAQFTSVGVAEVERLEPGLRGGDPFNPEWAFLAQCVYMRHQVSLWSERQGLNLVEATRAALASYNAGRPHILREWRVCRDTEWCNEKRWSGHIDRICSRMKEACNESRNYVQHIERRNPKYSGWF